MPGIYSAITPLLPGSYSIRKFENLHIVFWLLKDSCWMLEMRYLGALMVLPTLYLALHITIKTRRTQDFYINMAILCWILANSYWMIVEFFFNDRMRLLAAMPFALGFVFVFLFYLRARQKQGAAAAP